jgi:hypothetical protein
MKRKDLEVGKAYLIEAPSLKYGHGEKGTVMDTRPLQPQYPPRFRDRVDDRVEFTLEDGTVTRHWKLGDTATGVLVRVAGRNPAMVPLSNVRELWDNHDARWAAEEQAAKERRDAQRQARDLAANTARAMEPQLTAILGRTVQSDWYGIFKLTPADIQALLAHSAGSV